MYVYTHRRVPRERSTAPTPPLRPPLQGLSLDGFGASGASALVQALAAALRVPVAQVEIEEGVALVARRRLLAAVSVPIAVRAALHRHTRVRFLRRLKALLHSLCTHL